MRALIGLGLAALAATANGQLTVTVSNPTATSSAGLALTPGNQAWAQVTVLQTSFTSGVVIPVTNFSPQLPTVAAPSKYYILTLPSTTITSLGFAFAMNAYVGQVQYAKDSTGSSYTCDACSTPCDVTNGPGTSSNSFGCASFTRQYLVSGIVVTTTSTPKQLFSVQIWDRSALGGSSTYQFEIKRPAPVAQGDPQITGMQGQDFQVHGIPDEIFNMITYPNLQVNARFVYLSAGACHDNFTACFAHPGTYIGEEGIRVGKDKVHVVAGSFKKGLTVSVNGVRVSDKKTALKLGSVEIVNHRRVVVKTPIMSLTISNSDKFLNQETSLYDEKLLALGADRKVLLVGESFHPEVPLHGLQGQTWRNVEYASGLEYEGSISDYHVTSGNLFGSDFVFNQYKQ